MLGGLCAYIYNPLPFPVGLFLLFVPGVLATGEIMSERETRTPTGPNAPLIDTGPGRPISLAMLVLPSPWRRRRGRGKAYQCQRLVTFQVGDA